LGGYDDFIVRLEGEDCYAWVHLTWRSERSPDWPHTEWLDSLEVLNRFLGRWDDEEDESNT
jgi:hypothetical protein